MANLGNKAKDNPKLVSSTLSDGRIRLSLEYYYGRTATPIMDENGQQVYYTDGLMAGKPKYSIKHNRSKKALNLYLIAKPRTPEERQRNKETLELAKRIRFEKEQETNKNIDGYRLKKDKQINFMDYFQAYIDGYQKQDIRMVEIALQRFKDFLRDTPKYNMFQSSIKPQQLNKDMIISFVEYLKKRSVGEGANSIYARFKKVIKYAVEHDVIIKNPCTDISIKADENSLKKAVLSPDEIQLLANTHYENESDNIRRAFLFCCYSGLRFVDAKALTFGNVDYANNLLSFDQKKTTGHAESSWVYINLNTTLLSLIGPAPEDGNRGASIFNLATYESCTKALRRWVNRAGINKPVTWHSGRHSFGTNLAANNINPVVIKSLMGHSSLKYTERYVRAAEKIKVDALNSLPDLKL